MIVQTRCGHFLELVNHPVRQFAVAFSTSLSVTFHVLALSCDLIGILLLSFWHLYMSWSACSVNTSKIYLIKWWCWVFQIVFHLQFWPHLRHVFDFSILTRPKPVVSAMFSIQCRERPLFASRIVIDFGLGICLCAMLQCDMETWPRSTMCFSFLCVIRTFAMRWLRPHVLSLKMKSSIFSFPSWNTHLHMLAPAWTDRATLHGIAEAPPHFRVSRGIVYDLFIIMIIVQSDVNASLFSRSIQFRFVLQSMALSHQPFDIFDHSSGHMFPGLVVTCFFVSLPWTHVNPSGGFFGEPTRIV